ncbi:hypothetical protein [Bacillus niameyensis]|uniref:hypothetical protein n=1 Tax=Bacillus niameyensis TaxID=1522308 RepID=UPI000782DC38|nr:hypothetical protein [Bacillus niameyensis]
MNYSGLAIMALVWGILFIYFLTPFQKKAQTKALPYLSFADALKNSFFEITFHKKAILGFVLLLITVLATWWSRVQTDFYNEIHAIHSAIKQPNYILGIIFYAAIIYLAIIGRKAFKFMRGKF